MSMLVDPVLKVECLELRHFRLLPSNVIVQVILSFDELSIKQIYIGFIKKQFLYVEISFYNQALGDGARHRYSTIIYSWGRNAEYQPTGPQ